MNHHILKIGIIGTGRIAGRFVQAARSVSGVELVSVYNPHVASAKRFADGNSSAGKTLMYIDRLLEFLDSVDVVYIASLHETHADYVRQALQNGKHVLCEKPMCFSGKEAKELFALAGEMGCVLREAVKTSYCPGYQAMIEMAKGGKIGEIRDVEACFTKLTPTNLREMTDLTYGGSLTELGSYVFLPIFQLLGTDYQKVSFYSLDAPNGLDIYTKTMFEYKDGMGTAKTGLGVKSEGQLVIAGTKGYILSESPWWLTKKFEVRYENPDQREVYQYPFEGSGLQYELEALVQTIHHQSEASGMQSEEGIGAIAEMEQFAEESAEKQIGSAGTQSGESAQKQISGIGMRSEESIAAASVLEQFLKENSAKRNQNWKEKEDAVRIWAHRGCCMNHPENTLEAFEAAAGLPQVTGVELDVQLTKDGAVVVTHDENVSRVTDGTKNVADYTLRELKSLKISAGDGKYTTIPTFEEVLQLLAPYCKTKGLLINIELKTGKIHYEGIEAKTIELVREFELEDYVIYSSFWAESLRLIRGLCPFAQTGMLASHLSDCIKGGRYAAVDALHPWIGGLDCKIPEDMKDMPVRAWNVEEPFYGDGRILKEKNLKKYAMYGVTDLFTNVPEIYV